MPSKLGVSTADRRHALDLAAALGACSQREEVSGAFKELPGFVGAESVTFGEVQVPSRLDAPLIMRAECSDPSIYDAQMMEAISRLWRQQPVIVHQLRSPTPHPVKISDLSCETTPTVALAWSMRWRRTSPGRPGASPVPPCTAPAAISPSASEPCSA